MYRLTNLFLLGTINADIYDEGKNQINASFFKIIKIVGGVGTGAFTLAILIIALVIIFGSISSAKMRTVWMALISCCAGAFIFFTAYLLAPAIAEMASGG